MPVVAKGGLLVLLGGLAQSQVDNKVVGQTNWGPVGRQAWNQTFAVELERVSVHPHLPQEETAIHFGANIEYLYESSLTYE